MTLSKSPRFRPLPAITEHKRELLLLFGLQCQALADPSTWPSPPNTTREYILCQLLWQLLGICTIAYEVRRTDWCLSLSEFTLFFSSDATPSSVEEEYGGVFT